MLLPMATPISSLLPAIPSPSFLNFVSLTSSHALPCTTIVTSNSGRQLIVVQLDQARSFVLPLNPPDLRSFSSLPTRAGEHTARSSPTRAARHPHPHQLRPLVWCKVSEVTHTRSQLRQPRIDVISQATPKFRQRHRHMASSRLNSIDSSKSLFVSSRPDFRLDSLRQSQDKGTTPRLVSSFNLVCRATCVSRRDHSCVHDRST